VITIDHIHFSMIHYDKFNFFEKLVPSKSTEIPGFA